MGKFFLIIIVVVVALLVSCSKKEEYTVFRIAPETPVKTEKWGDSYQSVDIKTLGTNVYMEKDKKGSTVKGTLFRPGRGLGVLRFRPPKTGEYVVDFFYLLQSTQGKPVDASLKHMRKDGTQIRVIPLTGAAGTGNIARFRKILDLDADGIIAISGGGADFGFIGHPAIYKHEKAPHFVFLVVADTLRWDFLGVYNRQKRCSPNIDTFARDTAVFTQAYSTAPWTLPSHVSLFTGLFPNKHHVNYQNTTLYRDKKRKVLVEKLQEKFLTYSINDSHLVSSRFGFYRGFDLYAEFTKAFKYRTASKRTFESAKQFISEEKSGNAFFFLHSFQVHQPYNPEMELAKEYYKRIGRGDFDQFDFNLLKLIKKGKELFKKIPEKERKDIERVYEADIYTFDHRFGQFIAFLKEKNIYKNSMIILLSDHGEEFMDHGAWEHGHSLYNELIKIPLLVKFPDNRYAGRKIDRPVSIADVLPTIMETENILIDETMDSDGVSLLRAIEGNGEKKRDIIAYLGQAVVRRKIPKKVAVISENLKMIYAMKIKPKNLDYFTSPPPPMKHEMFDIFKDPWEKTNIIARFQKEKRRFISFIKKLSFKKGKKQVPKELEKDLKALGYL
ncbi:MAG: sulfatase [bacterium]|nr:sulfatase [bacterium]